MPLSRNPPLSPVSLVGSYMRNEETGHRKNLHSEKLHNLYVLPDVRMIKQEWSRACSAQEREVHSEFCALLLKDHV